MKRLSWLAVFALALLMTSLTGGYKTCAAEQKDIDAAYNDAVETLGDEGAPAFWRASYYLGKIGEEGVMTLDQGLDDKDVLVNVACARRLLDLYKSQDTDNAKKYVEKSEALLLRIAGDKTAQADVRQVVVKVLGTAGGKDKCGPVVAAIAADKAEGAALRLAAAEAEYMLTGAFTQKEFVESLLKGDDFRLRMPAAVMLFTIAQAEPTATVLQEYREDMSIEGLLANRLLKNKELRDTLRDMKGVGAGDITQQVLDDLQKEYDTLFKEAEDITDRVKALRSYGRALADRREEEAKGKGEGGEGGEGGPEKPPEPPGPPQPPGPPPPPGPQPPHPGQSGMPMIISLWLAADANLAARPVWIAEGGANVEKQFNDAMALLKDGDPAAFWEAFRRAIALDKDAAQFLADDLAKGGTLEKIACAGALLRAYGTSADDAAVKYIKDSEDALWKILKDEREASEARQLATDILGKYGQATNSKALLELADTAFDPFVRLSAIRSAYFLTKEMRGKDFLREKLESDDLDVKGWAVIMLCEMGDFENVRKYFEVFKYEPTLRGKLIQQYIVYDGLLKKLETYILGPPQVEQYALLQIEIARIKGEIAERNQALDAVKAMADAEVKLMKPEEQPLLQKDVDDIYKGIKTEGGEEGGAAPEGGIAPPAGQPAEPGPTPEPAPEPEPAPAADQLPVSPGLQKALDAMQLDKAPTLGATFKQFIIAYANGRFDLLFDMTAAETQTQLIGSPLQYADRIRTSIKAYEEKLKDPNLAPADKEAITRKLDNAKGALKGDPKKCFIWVMESMIGDRNPAVDMIGGKAIVTGEKIDGDTGEILLNPPGSYFFRSPFHFLKVNGVWKLNQSGSFHAGPSNP